MSSLVHAAELARQLKVSRMTISKAFKSGRIAQAATGPKGQPLFDLEEVRRTFFPDPAMTVRPDGLQGGRPVYKQGYKSKRRGREPERKPDPAPVPVAVPTTPSLCAPDGIPLDYFCREELVENWPEVEAAIDAGRLTSVGTFPGSGSPAFSYIEAARLMRPELAAMTDAEIKEVFAAELDAEFLVAQINYARRNLGQANVEI